MVNFRLREIHVHQAVGRLSWPYLWCPIDGHWVSSSMVSVKMPHLEVPKREIEDPQPTLEFGE